ncbi:hypothetical protein PT974_07643 [Cladobotryum mycophilum]|uniref:Uncharacterized protein n=1 Tax=Cladobotryum mycophilum TaxID=491253 RepID=A0ABR0SR51_9HYPO
MKFTATFLLLTSLITSSHASISKREECPGFLGNCAEDKCCEGLKCVDDTCVPDECPGLFASCADDDCCKGLTCVDDTCIVEDNCSELFGMSPHRPHDLPTYED